MSSFAIAASPASAYLHERSAGPGGDPVAEHERVESWRESAFLDDPVLDIRLRELGLSRAEFGRLLTDGAYDAGSTALDWAGELAAVLATGTGAVTGLARSTKLWAQGFDRLAFAGLIERFLAYYEPRVPRTAGTVRVSLLESLANRLLTVATRTLLLELNVARVHGRLTGATPGERYDHYDRVLLTDPDYLRSLFGEYPVLGRAMVECGRRWASAMAELFQRLDADRPALHAAGLLPAGAGEVTALRPDLGDPHNSGRAVAILTFRSGAQLVYKPRPVGPERAYAETAAALNRHGLSLPPAAPTAGASWSGTSRAPTAPTWTASTGVPARSWPPLCCSAPSTCTWRTSSRPARPACPSTWRRCCSPGSRPVTRRTPTPGRSTCSTRACWRSGSCPPGRSAAGSARASTSARSAAARHRPRPGRCRWSWSRSPTWPGSRRWKRPCWARRTGRCWSAPRCGPRSTPRRWWPASPRRTT